jgi:hypothetical protein
LKEFTDYNSKIDNDNHSEENFDHKTDKITDNLETKKKGFTAVPSSKNGNVAILKVGFSAAPNQKNGQFEIVNVGFTAVPKQNNGTGSILNKGLSVVPSRINRTKFQDQLGLSAVPNKKNGHLKRVCPLYPYKKKIQTFQAKLAFSMWLIKIPVKFALLKKVGRLYFYPKAVQILSIMMVLPQNQNFSVFLAIKI